MKRGILLYPDPRLRQVSAPVETHTADRALIDDLVETMKANGGAAIAAIQVGVPQRIFVVRNPENEEKPLVFINPTWRYLAETPEQKPVKEGCLSFPGFYEDVVRYSTVQATYEDVEGIEYVQTFQGIVAQAIQHEFEHLDGKLLSDNLSFTKTNQLKMHMKQYARRPQETMLKSFGLDPRQFRNMQRPTGARRTS